MDVGRGIISAGLVYAVCLSAALAHAQQSQLTSSPAVISLEDAPHVETQSLEELSVGSAGDPTSPVVIEPIGPVGVSANLEQPGRIVGQLAGAGERSVQLQNALEELRRQLELVSAGSSELLASRLIREQQRRVEALRDDFLRIQGELERSDQVELANGAARMSLALDSLQERLALLGLVLVKKGDKARLPNALKFDLDLLRRRQRELGQIVKQAVAADPSLRIIRPPSGIQPPNDPIRPPSGIEPPNDPIRPPSGIEPSNRIIRPPSGIQPPNRIIRPPSGIQPSNRIIRPASGIQPPNRIIRPPTSVNPTRID
jgi:hypothetical protein